MDHMHISDNEPSSVILSQTKWIQKLKMIVRNCHNQAEAKSNKIKKNNILQSGSLRSFYLCFITKTSLKGHNNFGCLLTHFAGKGK